MINGSISLLPNLKKILICPKGISFSQMEVMNGFGIETQIYREGELKRSVNHFSDESNLDLLKHYPDFQVVMMVKNPYWRIFEIYYRNLLFSYPKNLIPFNELVLRMYTSETLTNHEKRIKKYFFDVKLDLPYDIIKCENFKEDVYNKLGYEVKNEPDYMSLNSSLFSLYFENSESLSDFYDLKTATMIYENNIETFKSFGYSFYSYLDFHSPIKKIHHLHKEY